MTLYEYNGPGDHYLNGGDRQLTPGDDVEFDEEPAFPEFFDEVETEEETESSDEGDEVPSDEEEEESDGSERASEGEALPFNPTDLTVDEIEAELDAGEFTEDELMAVKEAEEMDQERTTALDAIEDAKAAL